MNRITRVSIVVGGYVAAIVAAVVAAWLYDVRMSRMPYDTSGGMYAGGQMLTSLAAFLAVALVPTLAGLWFLRRHRGLWNGIAISAIAFAGVGLVAVLLPLSTRHAHDTLPLVFLELFGLAQLLGVPLWTIAFMLFAVMAPTRESRRGLIASVAIELVIGVCAFVHWFVPRPPF